MHKHCFEHSNGSYYPSTESYLDLCHSAQRSTSAKRFVLVTMGQDMIIAVVMLASCTLYSLEKKALTAGLVHFLC